MGAQYLAISAWEPDLLITKAKGSKIWLNGKPYFDFACGPGVANVGWNHPEVIKAVKQVLGKNEAGWGGNMILNKYAVELAEKLCQITPGNFPKKVFFSNSGGEAVEAAMLACMRRRPERRGMASFIGDFHGRLGLCRTATTSRRMHFEKMPWGIEKPFFLAFPAENPETPAKKAFMDTVDTPQKYLAYVDNTIGPFINDINFALFELIQGEGGINAARIDVMELLTQYLRSHGVWIIIDEVQTGLARTGEMWASNHYGIEPDIITVAKALSGGIIPVGATIMREELSFKEIGEHCNTFGGGAPACAVGLKVLEIIQKGTLAKDAESKGQLLRESLGKVTDVSGLGLMNRATFKRPEIKKMVIAEARKRGLYLTGAGEQSVRLMPPLTISGKELEQAARILTETIQAVHSEL